MEFIPMVKVKRDHVTGRHFVNPADRPPSLKSLIAMQPVPDHTEDKSDDESCD